MTFSPCFFISFKHFVIDQFSFARTNSLAISPPAESSLYDKSSFKSSAKLLSLISEITSSFLFSESSPKISAASSLSSSSNASAISFTERALSIFSLTSSLSSVRISEVFSLSNNFIK